MSENALGLASVRDQIVAEKRLNLSFVQGVIFHSNLLHKSGEYLSNSTRFVALSQ